MKKIILPFFASFFCMANILIAQNNNQFWKPIEEKNIKTAGERVIIPKKYKIFELESDNLKTALLTAPQEENVKLNNSSLIISLPMPDGKMQQFKAVESPVMAKELAAQFPDIKTYSIKGVDDVYASGKLDWTEFGFHGMIRSPNGDVFIDPYSRGNKIDYITYYTVDFEKNPADIMHETGVIDNTKTDQKKSLNIGVNAETRAMICVGSDLRTYRFAVACTGEYAKAATGLATPTTAQALAAIVTTVNRVDGVYETDLAIKLVLVAQETSVVFTDPATDPFTGNNSANTLINESQTVIDNKIGSTNYDAGHTFSTGGGGLSSLGVICQAGSKASSITGSSKPVGDPYDIDYVAHEVGHSFGGRHTFACKTGSCSGNQSAGTMVEPGSGVTIMAYAGICTATNDLDKHSIAYFHTISYDEIVTYTNTGSGNSCPVKTTTGNHPPTVTGSVAYSIPNSTPFTLTGSATDPDNDPLTYSWEEIDNNSTGGNWNSGNAPYFRSYNPVISPSRMFPLLNVVLSGNMTGTIGEYLPSKAQTLNFRLVGRDNKMGGGGVCYASGKVIITTAGPFNITYPNAAGISWAEASSQTITWNVGGTTASPVSCANVDLYISTDGGTTFQLLLANTPNDGTETITVPTTGATITTCRIKAVCPSNIFFDINDANFTITSNASGIIEYSETNSIPMKLMPNPFHTAVEISAYGLNVNEKTTLAIYDVLGNVIRTEEVSASQNLALKYDLSSLNNGVYIIHLINGNKRSIARLVKQ